jgi:hypothetical protein
MEYHFIMLQRVALGQVRFNLTGLSTDGRGVATGRQCAVRFGAIDRLVAFFRILSAQRNLDDLQPGLRLLNARSAAGPREMIVILPTGSTHLADAVASAARTAGGQCFTGDLKHFVQYRDGRAPLGYDAAEVATGAGEIILYAAEQTVAYQIESELPFPKLLLRLPLQRQHGAPAGPPSGGVLYVVVRRGLGPTVAQYLYRAQRLSPPSAADARPWLRAAAALCDESSDGSAFQPGRSFWLFRLEGVPARMMGLLSSTPGLEPYVPATDNVAVALGHRHPIHLEACKSSFAGDRFFLFAAGGRGVTVLSPLPTLTALEDLVRVGGARAHAPEVTAARLGPRPDVAVPLRLEAVSDVERRAVATLIPWRQVAWLRRLCYALPAPALRSHRVALLDRGVLVLSSGVLDGIPFGMLLDSAAPDVLVPLGARLRPAVSPALLAAKVGAKDGAVVVCPALDALPFRVPPEAIEPLERQILGSAEAIAIDAAEPRRHPTQTVQPAPVEIENDWLGPMPLWGLGPSR